MKHFLFRCNERCEGGRTFRYEVLHDDPHFAMDIGRCEECEGVGCDRLHRQAAEKIAGDKIVTTNIFPPIPDRRFDWCATRSNDEPNDNGSMLQGFGRTEQDAIDDLVAVIEDARS